MYNNIPSNRTTLTRKYTRDEDINTSVPDSIVRKGAIALEPILSSRTQKPRVFETERRCKCGTKLSKYNKGPECYKCKPVDYGRVRGRN